jgi:osomolarity two-component system, sensor histidine kinase SLN1
MSSQPVLSGVQMVKRLRELGRTEFIGKSPHLNVRPWVCDIDYAYSVGITGNALKEDQAEYMEAGLDKVLTKPVLERSLKEMLKLVLDRRRTPE